MYQYVVNLEQPLGHLNYLNPDIFHINLYHVAAMATLFSGFTLALLLAFAKREGQAANLFLSAALAVIVLKTGGLSSIFLPALGPLLYFYVRRMTAPNLQFGRKDVLHFCPLLVAYWLPGWLVLISVVIYLYLSHRLIQHFYSRLQPVLMDKPRFAFRRLDKALHLLGLLCVLWLFNDALSFAVAFVLIGMASEVMLKLDSSTQLATPITDRYDAKEKSRRLKEAVAANRLYEDAELTLTTLAAKLNIHPHDLSRIINVGMEKNFNDFINEFRVREVARKMQDPAHDRLTLLGIAYESGFNSQRTFNRVFKEMTGKTPVEYKNGLKKELPNDKLAIPSHLPSVILRSGSPPGWAPVKLNRNYMFKNYLTIAWRNLIKNKLLSLINIGGLAVGMAVVMLISLWILDEVTFNGYHKNYGRIAKVVQNIINNGGVETWFVVPYPLAAELRKSYSSDFPEVAMQAADGDHILTLGDKKLSKHGSFMEPQGPDIFSLKMLAGTKNALNDPSSIIISASTAKAYFNNADPIGRVLKFDNQTNLKVAGVYEDIPKNSDLAGMDFIAPWQMLYNIGQFGQMKDPWRPNIVHLYVKLADNADLDAVSLKIRDVKLNHVSGRFAKRKPALFLFPMSKWHLYSDFKGGVNRGGRIQYVWLFGVIGMFVLLLACINFMNLSTARSEKRAREVGIRKTIGSSRSQLIYQFLSEALLCVLMAFVISLLLAQLALPFFNQVADKQVNIPWDKALFWIVALAFCLATGMITGSYPAFYLSSFKPIKVLKGTFRVGRFAAVPRKVLVIVQFAISVVLIIGTIVVFREVQFAKNRPVGYGRQGLVAVPTVTSDIHKNFETVKADLFKAGAITAIAEAPSAPTVNTSGTSGISWPGKDPNVNVDFAQNAVSFDYGKTIGWQLVEGRDFSRDFLTDTAAIIINQTAAKFMGLKNPVGQIIHDDKDPIQIIGIVKDMINDSPYDPVKPTAYFLSKGPGDDVLLRINPGKSATRSLDKIATVFKTYNPGQPFEYRFVDQEYNKKFGDEERYGTLASFFASLAILISCLGLFGMASFMAEQRIKEIGVRKVLGASVLNLWGLLSKDFVVLVAISLLIAIPAAYYFMYKWLLHFQYRSDLAWWIFASAGAGALIIAMLTVSYQSIKAALANPIKSLKTE